MSATAIEFALEKSRAAEPWVRPYVMDALIRNGSKQRDVLDAFEATDDECSRVDELAARPPLYGEVAA